MCEGLEQEVECFTKKQKQAPWKKGKGIGFLPHLSLPRTELEHISAFLLKRQKPLIV